MKNILIGITGGISAYKTVSIVSNLRQKGYHVKVIMTENAQHIVPALTLEVLSRNNVITDMWERQHQINPEHIALGEWADVFLIAPATYNIIGKVASGIADDMLSTTISACIKPIFFALAMNSNMYRNPILQENIQKLSSLGYRFIDADSGFLACNTHDKGRLKNEIEIVSIIEAHLHQQNILAGKKILITAGRTEEALDPVRYLSNYSSGKMGYALAEAAAAMGAQVTLITGSADVNPPFVNHLIRVKSALQMNDAVLSSYPEMDIAIACAAVSDYRPVSYSSTKIKKTDAPLTITLEKNPDILQAMGQQKKKQILVGFAAETDNLIENALSKLRTKNLDFIVANNASNLQKNTNKIFLINKKEEITEFPEKLKKELAYEILLTISGNNVPAE